MSDDDNLLSRWSRRKRAVAKEAEAGPPAPQEETEPPAESADEDEEAALARLELPVPESLGPGDDFTPFLRAEVPEFLRRRALRVLWRSNPVLANVDGLNDYDEDFTSPEMTQKVLATSYKVGKGIVRKILETDEGRPGESLAAQPEVVTDAENGTPDDTEAELPTTLREVPKPDTAPEDDAGFRPRRMSFRT